MSVLDAERRGSAPGGGSYLSRFAVARSEVGRTVLRRCARKIFAHLVNLKPTPEELTQWMSTSRGDRAAGAEYGDCGDDHATAGIGILAVAENSRRMRSGCCPRRVKRSGAGARMSGRGARKGWVFLTSKATTREQLRPLLSLWLDLLALRVMNEGASTGKEDVVRARRAGDAATSAAVDDGDHGGRGNRIIRWFWASRARRRWRRCTGTSPRHAVAARDEVLLQNERATCVGVDLEIHRRGRGGTVPGSRTRGVFPQNAGERAAGDYARAAGDGCRRSAGLSRCTGIWKHGNLVVRMRIPYLKLEEPAEKFIERKMTTPAMPATERGASCSVRQREAGEAVPSRKKQGAEHSSPRR